MVQISKVAVWCIEMDLVNLPRTGTPTIFERRLIVHVFIDRLLQRSPVRLRLSSINKATAYTSTLPDEVH